MTLQLSIIKPRVVAFEVTRRCRYQCLHCRAEASLAEDMQELTTTQCKRILQGLANYRNCVVVFTGGEPLERKDIYELIDAGHALGHRVALASSGYPITDDIARRLKGCGLLTLSFSLDAPDAQSHDTFRGVRGAYQAVLSAIRRVQRQGLLFQINTAVTQRNLGQVLEIAELAQELGAYCFNPFILVPTGRGAALANERIDSTAYEELLLTLAEMKKSGTMDVCVTCGPQFRGVFERAGVQGIRGKRRPMGCQAGGEFAFINYRGDVQTCGYLDISAGNLIENEYDFAIVWEQSAFLNKIRDRSQYTGPCGMCVDLETCGGCRARAKALTGDYLASDPICFGPE